MLPALLRRSLSRRFVVAAVVVLMAATASVTWMLHRTDIDFDVNTATARRPLVVQNGKVTQMPAGDYLAANTLVDTSACSTTNVIKWDGTQFACGAGGGGSGGGITNSAGNNVVMKSNSTNAVASSMTDDGTEVISSDLGVTDSDFGQKIALKLNGPEGLLTTSTGADGYDTQMVLKYLGVGHVGEMINFNDFLQGTINTTAAPVQAIGVQTTVTTSKSAGSNTLTNAGYLVNVSGGDTNYSFWATSGEMRVDDQAQFQNTITANLTTGGTLADLSASTAIKLNSNVSSFVVPGSSSLTGSIGLGTTQSDGTGIQIKNTVAANSSTGVDVALDTTVNSGIRGGYFILRGAGGGYASGNSAGFVVAGGAGFPFTDTVANDLAFYTELGASILFGADDSGFTSATRVTKSNHWVQDTSTGLPTLGAGCTSGTGSAIVGNDNKFEVTVGTTSTACTITFKKTWTLKPICNITTEGGSALPTYTVSATAITITTNVNSGVYNVDCQGQPGST